MWFRGWADMWFLSRPEWRLRLDEAESPDTESQAIGQYRPWDWPQRNQGRWGLCGIIIQTHFVLCSCYCWNIWHLCLKHVRKQCKCIEEKESNSRPLDETIQHCPLVFQGTTCTLRHHGHVFKGTRLACSLHSLTWPQSRAPRVLAESHTVSPSTTTWRANILVSGTAENNMLKHTCNVPSHGSYHRNLTTLYTVECILALSGTRGNAVLDPCHRNLCVCVGDVLPKFVCFRNCLSVWLKGAVGVWFIAVAGHNQSFGRAVHHNMLSYTATMHISCCLYTCAPTFTYTYMHCIITKHLVKL